MEITGRLTKSAEVRKTKDNREVVSFTVAINNKYKKKDGTPKDASVFINCSYWQSSKIADYLKKGSIVSLSGHLGLNTYKDMNSEYHAYITFHCNSIQILDKGGAATEPTSESKSANVGSPQSVDDLPF